MRRRVPSLALACLVASAALAACSDDGRALAPVRPDQTTTTATTAPDVGSVAPEQFTFMSAAFADGAPIPADHTCDGGSPPLSWTNVPVGPELAIVVRDRQADGYVHWIVTGIDPTFSGFGANAVPEGAVEQVNATGAIGWIGPCPPEGSGTHFYDFTLHVLGTHVEIDPGLPASEAAALVEAASVERATFSGTVTSESAPADDAPVDGGPAVGSQSE